MTKPHENEYDTYRTSSKRNTRTVAEKDSTDAQLPSIDSEESNIGDIQAFTSELFENDLPLEFLQDICYSKLGEKSESFADVIGANPHHSMDEYLRYSYPDDHFSDISFSSYGEDSVIRDILEDYEKSKFLFPQKKTDYFNEAIQTKSNIRKSESNLGNTSVKWKRNLILSKSDSCIAKQSEAKTMNDEFNFLNKKFLGVSSNLNTSKQIMILDSAKLSKTSDDNVAGYNWQTYGRIKTPLEDTLPVPQANSLDLYDKCTATHLTIGEYNQRLNNHHSNHNGYQLIKNNSEKSLKLCSENNKNLKGKYSTTVGNIKDNEIIQKSTDCSQYKETVNNCLNLKYSFEQAMSQEHTNVKKYKSVNNTNNLFLKLKRIKMSPFKNHENITKSKCGSNKQSNCSCLSKDNGYKYPKEDEFATEQNSTMTASLEQTSVSMDAFLLNSEQSIHKKQVKKSKKMRNKWIRYLCPGSRTC